jgi:release factor glutamine methyltransferase
VLHEVTGKISGTSDSPILDTQVLLANIMGKTRTWILAHPDATLTEEQADLLYKAVERLELGEPLPYVLGQWEFFGLVFTITPDVLIPRPETELLIEYGLTWIRAHPGTRFALDIGTGSGCIAISLAVNAPNLMIVASDISLKALKVAHQNMNRHNVNERIFPVAAQLFPPTQKRYDLVCANLPYIPTERLHTLSIFGKEPNLALDGGELGLKLIEKLLQEAPQYLVEEGLMLVEIDSSQAELMYKLTKRVFPEAKVDIILDLSGKERLVSIQPKANKL